MTDNRISAAPQLEFEAMLAQLVERADDMMQSQRRLRDLLRVGQVLSAASTCRPSCGRSSRRVQS